MFAVDQVLHHGGGIMLSNVLRKNVESEGRTVYFSAICEGDKSDAKPHTVVRKRGISSQENIDFPDGSTVLAIHSNRNKVRNCSIYYAVPDESYDFDGIEVNADE